MLWGKKKRKHITVEFSGKAALPGEERAFYHFVNSLHLENATTDSMGNITGRVPKSLELVHLDYVLDVVAFYLAYQRTRNDLTRTATVSLDPPGQYVEVNHRGTALIGEERVPYDPEEKRR